MNKHRKGNSGEPETHDDRQANGADFVTLTDEMAEASVASEERWQELQSQLQEKERELAELKDKYLRALADGENARKRIRQQSEESVRIQKEGILRDLLPIVDNLERAVGAAREGVSDTTVIVEGVQMVLRSLLDFLKSQGVVPIVSAGQPFDPARHEAVDQVASDTHPPNTVVKEFHRGYLIGDRVLRPASVTVAKGVVNRRNNGESDTSEVEND
ncbi:MAG TPA: nucleotide exchange factor GrpE [Candidatus Binataceae bacterium]|nr:nucleotide exchange factor GrpE [Candidatus Binataceae bacterium]